MPSHVTRPQFDELPPEAQQRWLAEDSVRGITHMKQTLLHSIPAYDALMSWYPLRDALIPFIGERGAIVLSHAISTQNECLICSLYFRRALIARGEDASGSPLSAEEEDLASFGRQIADSNKADDDVTGRIKERIGEQGLVLLVAFAGIMVATNIVNNALDVDPDRAILELFEGPSDPFAGFGEAAARSLAASVHAAESGAGAITENAAAESAR